MNTRKPSPDPGKLFPVKRTADRFSLSPHALYKAIREGRIPHYKFGKKILLDPDEVRAALRVPTATSPKWVA